MAIKHAFSSAAAEGADATKVRTSNWNADHTIDDATLALVKLVTIPTTNFLSRITGGTGAVEAITPAQARTNLALATVATTGAAADVSGLATIATTGSATNLASGTVPAARMPALTGGDITSTIGTVVATINNDAVAYAKMQNVSATQRALGRNTAGAGDVEEVTGTQIFDWVASAAGSIPTRGASVWAAVANVVVDAGDFVFSDSIAPAAPAAGKVKVYATSIGGREMLAQIGADNLPTAIQPHIGQRKPFRWLVGLNNAVAAEGMVTPSASGTATGRTPAATNSFTICRRVGLVSAAGAGSIGGLRNPTAFITRQQGFQVIIRFGIGDASIVTTGRTFVGLISNAGAPTDVDPSGLTNLIGVGCDANDGTFQVYGAGAAAQARAALPAAFVSNTTNVDHYELSMVCIPGAATITYTVKRLTTADVASGSLTGVQVPTATTFLTPSIWRTNGATASAVSLELFSMYGDTDN